MSTHLFCPEESQPESRAARRLALNRREFFEMAGAGLLIVAAAPLSEAQRGGAPGRSKPGCTSGKTASSPS